MGTVVAQNTSTLHTKLNFPCIVVFMSHLLFTISQNGVVSVNNLLQVFHVNSLSHYAPLPTAQTQVQQPSHHHRHRSSCATSSTDQSWGSQTAAQLTAEQACEFRNLRETTRGQQGTWTQFRRGGWAGLGYRFWSRDKAGDPGMS